MAINKMVFLSMIENDFPKDPFSNNKFLAADRYDLENKLLGNPVPAAKFYKALLHILVTRIRNTDLELAMRKAF